MSVGGGESQGLLPFAEGREPAEEETEVRWLIQQMALEHRLRYGYRRITAELRRRGMLVNRKRVARMMRDDNLQPRRLVVTTNSNHKLEVYLNLASRMKLTDINQLWVADFTYVRLSSSSIHPAQPARGQRKWGELRDANECSKHPTVKPVWWSENLLE